MLLFVEIKAEVVKTEINQEYDYLVNIGQHQFVSTCHYDQEFGYYFDNVKGKIAIQIHDPQIKEIYRIEPCE